MSEELDSQDSWRDRMRSHAGDSPQTLLAICDAFANEVPLLLERIRRAVESRDAGSLRTASHSLKSCLAYVAEPEDVRVAADLEVGSGRPDRITADVLREIEVVANRWLGRVGTLREEVADGLGAVRESE